MFGDDIFKLVPTLGLVQGRFALPTYPSSHQKILREQQISGTWCGPYVRSSSVQMGVTEDFQWKNDDDTFALLTLEKMKRIILGGDTYLGKGELR